jgi:hypothetical protein
MNDIRDCWDEAEAKRAKVEPRSAAPKAKGDEGCDRDASDAIAVEILRPNIVVAQQIKLEK